MTSLEQSEKRHQELKKIELDLTSYIRRDISTWADMYILMDRVQTEKLYMGIYPSFTSWINHMADKTGLHVSLFWKRLKAGQAFKTYSMTVKTSRDQETDESSKDFKVTITDSESWQDQMLRLSKGKKLPAESLELCGKIAGKDKKLLSHLVNSLLNGELTRSELKEAYRHKKECRKEMVKIDEPCEASPTDTEKTMAIKAAIRGNSNWIPCNSDSSEMKRSGYMTLEEVAIPTPSTRIARRIDSLVLETRSTQFASELRMHGIEVKVSISDLTGDHKMAEYAPYVDCFWIAVPDEAEIIEVVKSIKNDAWGVIAVGPETGIRVVEQADPSKSQQSGKLREQGLQAALRKVVLNSGLV